MNKAILSMAGLAALAAAGAANAANITIIDLGVINPGYSHSQDYVLAGEHRGYGMRFTITQDITLGSGLFMVHDTFGSTTDTETALYVDGGGLLAMNDDFDSGVNFDSYLAFGDASQPANPYNGQTRQGNSFANPVTLLAGTYVFVVGPYQSQWDEFDMFDSKISDDDTFDDGGQIWYCNLTYGEIPAPASLAVAGLGMFFVGGRKRRQA